jgi:hypothetical protein
MDNFENKNLIINIIAIVLAVIAIAMSIIH